MTSQYCNLNPNFDTSTEARIPTVLSATSRHSPLCPLVSPMCTPCTKKKKKKKEGVGNVAPSSCLVPLCNLIQFHHTSHPDPPCSCATAQACATSATETVLLRYQLCSHARYPPAMQWLSKTCVRLLPEDKSFLGSSTIMYAARLSMPQPCFWRCSSP